MLLGIALAAIVIPAFFARFMADDYCMNAGVQSASFSSYFNSIYNGWSGRFAYIASSYYLVRIAPQSFGFLVTGVVLIWVCLLAWMIKAGSQLFKIKINWIASFTLAVILLIALFKTAPNLYQNLYWRDGLVNYIVPLIFTSLCLLLVTDILRTKLTSLKALLLVFSAFLSAGFSESASIANLTFWVVILMFSLLVKLPRKKEILLTIATPALGALFGFLIEFLAPGNLVRSAILPDTPGFFELLGLTLRNVAHLFGRLLIYGFPWIFFCLLVGLYLGLASETRHEKPMAQKELISACNWLLGAALVNFMVGSGVCAAVAYLLKAYPDDRIVIIPYFFALMTVLMTGLRIGSWLGARKPTIETPKILQKSIELGPYILISLAFMIAFVLAFALVKNLPDLITYALRWDARDVLIRSELAAGKQDLVVAGLESRYGLPDLQYEKDDWVNSCTAGYYGAKSITGK